MSSSRRARGGLVQPRGVHKKLPGWLDMPPCYHAMCRHRSNSKEWTWRQRWQRTIKSNGRKSKTRHKSGSCSGQT
eukprot:352088-Chlamydomonas_euryale.AAC.17